MYIFFFNDIFDKIDEKKIRYFFFILKGLALIENF